ncbi:MAG: HD domain-containing protein, partial [Lachnospiraceae bacterium]|nr:HD domain-containing protein [Lachnospiraceae bacterium]
IQLRLRVNVEIDSSAAGTQIEVLAEGESSAPEVEVLPRGSSGLPREERILETPDLLLVRNAVESFEVEDVRAGQTHHHEKWNGTGYPDGLAGEDIPLSARVMAVADVFDALVSKRCYKEPYSFEDAMEIIRKDAGTHFDPKVAEAFLAAADEVRATSERYMDMAYTTKDIIR